MSDTAYLILGLLWLCVSAACTYLACRSGNPQLTVGSYLRRLRRARFERLRDRTLMGLPPRY
jgi:hypothetical protein